MVFEYEWYKVLRYLEAKIVLIDNIMCFDYEYNIVIWLALMYYNSN